MILHCKLDGTELIWFSHVNICGSHIYDLLLTFAYFKMIGRLRKNGPWLSIH